jgi:hypothetical protein
MTKTCTTEAWATKTCATETCATKTCPTKTCPTKTYPTKTCAISVLGGALLWMIALSACTAAAAEINDYPTATRADYVFACMKANGETRQSLERCSCSIDVIASLIPYERYVEAETVLSMSQVPGNLGNVFRATEFAKKTVDDLRRAQAEAEVRCF